MHANSVVAMLGKWILREGHDLDNLDQGGGILRLCLCYDLLSILRSRIEVHISGRMLGLAGNEELVMEESVRMGLPLLAVLVLVKEMMETVEADE